LKKENMNMKSKMTACATVIGFVVFAFGFTPNARAQTIAGSFQGTNSAGTNYFMGSVGVGTNRGPKNFTVNGDIAANGSIYYLNGGIRYLTHNTSDGSDTGQLYIQGGGGTLGFVTRGSSLYVAGNEAPSYGGRVYIQAGDVPNGNIYLTVSNFIYALTVIRSGNVGIGTISPSERLHVNGTGLFESGIVSRTTLVVGTGTATGLYAVAEGYQTTASGPYSHAEGYCATASGSSYGSHAEGVFATASGPFGSHAEGEGNIASAEASHAEGISSSASAPGSHAEGACAKAQGSYAHAEGYYCTASGAVSHAAGARATVLHDYTYAWSDGTTFSSTTSNQFSVCAANGIRLLGGPTVGVRGGDISMGTFTNMPPQ
jgi:hypothetical protein